MLYNEIEIAAIKLAVYNGGKHRISPQAVLLKSISWLCDLYECDKNEIYLQKAVWSIYAYLELGFLYKEGERIFEKVLGYLKKDKSELFPEERFEVKKMKITKTNIRNLLGNWNPVYHSMHIQDVVNDIYNKMLTQEQGTYTYHSGKAIEDTKNIELWEKTYRLIIDDTNIMFYDVRKNRYYVFERRDI